jgi:tricorn protease
VIGVPTILVTNQHTLSDGENFTQGYKHLKLGKVVGEPTAGWVIGTTNVSLPDGTVFRLPGVRWTTLEGGALEMQSRPVDVTVKRPIGEDETGKDSQLDAAVRELLQQLGSARSTN